MAPHSVAGALLCLLRFCEAGARPHVVFTIVDDAGVQDLGFSSALHGKGHTPIRTPFLDSLAEESVKLRSYYTHPVCTPSRAALMSGRYAYMVGMPFPICGKASALGLDPAVPTLADGLRDRGYHTAMVGKWHLGHAKDAYRPLRRGFSSYFGMLGGSFDHYTKINNGCVDMFRGNRTTGMQKVPPEEVDRADHATSLFSREAVKVIEANKGEPLFLYLAYTAPHDPLQADPEFVQRCGHVRNFARRMFCAMMAQLDEGVRNVTEALKRKGMWKNTMFVFTTDNGGMPTVGGFNYPFRGHKAESWEGAVRGPAFVRFPGGRSGTFDGLMHMVDWLPTILGEVDQGNDFKDKRQWELDGIDQRLAIQGKQEPQRNTVVPQLDIFLNTTAVRQGCLKLMLGPPGANLIYAEPTQDLYARQSLGLHILEKVFFRLSERLVGPPSDQFWKYSLKMLYEELLDKLMGTAYHIPYRGGPVAGHAASFQDHPPALQWGARPGPLVFLFDVCEDPSESRNLAEERREDVERLYKIIQTDARRAPIQYAGDVSLPDVDVEAGCSVFLSDDTDFMDVQGKGRRTFALLVGFIFGFFKMAFLLYLGASACCCICCLSLCWCCRGSRGKAKTS